MTPPADEHNAGIFVLGSRRVKMHENKVQEHLCRGKQRQMKHVGKFCKANALSPDLLVGPVQCLPPSCPPVSLLSASLLRRKSQTAH